MFNGQDAAGPRDHRRTPERRRRGHALAAAAVLSIGVLISSPASAATSPLRLADWKSWLHGDSAPPPKAPPPEYLARVSNSVESTDAAVGAAVPRVESFMRAFAAALKARDGRPLLTRLSPRYTIDDLPDDVRAADMFLQAIDQIPGPREIMIRSIALQGGDSVAQIEFRYEDKDKVKVKTFRFDAAGNLVASDLFALKRVHGG